MGTQKDASYSRERVSKPLSGSRLSEPTTGARQSEGGSLGAYIRAQRQVAAMSLRQLAALSNVSNAYLSQIERGLHQPSLKVVNAIAEALNVSTEYLLSQSGVLSRPEPGEETRAEAAILADPVLTDDEKHIVLGVYRRLRKHHVSKMEHSVGHPDQSA